MTKKLLDLWKHSQNENHLTLSEEIALTEMCFLQEGGVNLKTAFQDLSHKILESTVSIKQWFTIQMSRVEKYM